MDSAPALPGENLRLILLPVAVFVVLFLGTLWVFYAMTSPQLRPVPLARAWADGRLIIVGKSDGFRSLSLELSNRSDGALKVGIPQGQRFVNDRREGQDLAVAETHEVDLGPRETRTISLETYCVSPDREAPRREDVFVPGALVDDRLLSAIRGPGSFQEKQQRVWDQVQDREKQAVLGAEGAMGSLRRWLRSYPEVGIETLLMAGLLIVAVAIARRR